jgi:hypothetical protein
VTKFGNLVLQLTDPLRLALVKALDLACAGSSGLEGGLGFFESSKMVVSRGLELVEARPEGALLRVVLLDERVERDETLDVLSKLRVDVRVLLLEVGELFGRSGVVGLDEDGALDGFGLSFLGGLTKLFFKRCSLLELGELTL